MYDPNKNLQFFKFDTSKIKFKDLIKKHLKKSINCEYLEEFNNYIPEDKMPKDTMKGTAHTYGHDILYAVDPIFKQSGLFNVSDIGFIKEYEKFIKFLRDEIFQKSIIYQKKPSFRIHYPNFTSYGKFHRDSDYSHPKDEINIWVPITKTIGTASMMIESEINKKDFKPVELDYGEFLIFNSELEHGNVVNKENYTRMSLDLRVIPKDVYDYDFKKSSATQNIEFKIGSYYEIKS